MSTPVQPKVNVNLKDTTKVVSEDGNVVFQEGILLRKVSKFLTGGAQDGVMPITVFYDVVTGKILKDTLPMELWAEYGFVEEKRPVVDTSTEKTLKEKPKMVPIKGGLEASQSA